MSTTDLPGSSLLANRYRLVERLGAGGMSVVWRGFDEVLGRQVAVKVLPPSTSADPSFRRRLRAEAQAAARLSHPHITNVYDYGEATTVDGEPVPYVVMELIDGESLAAVLARVRRLPWPAAVRITSEVAAALAAAHSRGIVHRDVTPANVMLTASGAKVVDFGISALIGENDIDPDGSLLGTPAYLAPERLEGGQVSPATDVYAVGLLIYRTLIGQLPWDVGTTTALLRAHQYTEPDPLPPVDGLPPAVAALVGRCLEKRPSDRPSSAELAHVLAGIAAGAPPGTRGFGSEWSPDNGEDTTILPSQRSYAFPYGNQGPQGNPFPVDSLPAAHAGPGAGSRHNHFAAAVAVAASPVVAGSAMAGSGVAGSAMAGSGVAGSAMAGSGVASSGAASSVVAGPAGSGAVAAGPVAAGVVIRHLAEEPGNPALRPALGGGDGPPSSDRPVPAPAGIPRPRRAVTTRSRRALVVTAAIVLLGGGTYGFTLTGDHSKANGAALVKPPQPSVVPPTGKCVVSYAVFTDQNHRFSAEVTLANRAETAVRNWKLWFIMPGDQVVSGNGKVQLTQQQHGVTVTAAKTLKPQTTLTLPITGRYANHNNAPLAFNLNGATCETFVSSKPGEPSRKVEHLSNGQVRLSATPPAAAPVPGISIDPGGIVHITPTSAPPVVLPGTSTGPVLPVITGTTPTAVITTNPVDIPTTSSPPIEAAPPSLETTPATTAPTTEPTPTKTASPPTSQPIDCDPTADDCSDE